jgi:hypothetical protein
MGASPGLTLSDEKEDTVLYSFRSLQGFGDVVLKVPGNRFNNELIHISLEIVNNIYRYCKTGNCHY